MSEPSETRSRAARRRAILDAAVETFAEKGFFASRTREIAARAGVAEGTIYLYFESKDDLLLSAFREKVSEFVEAARSPLTTPLPFPERLLRFIELQFASIEADPALAMVLLLESRQSTKFYGGAVRDVLRTYAGAIDELLASGVASGAVRVDADLPIIRRVLIGALEEMELDWLLGDRSWRLSALAPRLAETLYRGLKP